MDWGRQRRIERDAARWVVAIDEPDFSPAAAERCRRWLLASADHRLAFQRAQSAWTGLDQLGKLARYPELLAVVSAPANDLPSQPAPLRLGRRAVLMGAGAGALALGAGGAALLVSGSSEAYETGIGERREVALSDGSHIFLNAGTRVETHVTASERRARLVRGEALFRVTAQSGALFSIATAAGGVDIAQGEVLVKLLPAGARVSLLSDAGRAWKSGWAARDTRVALQPRSEIELGGADVRVAESNASALSRRTLWREGRLAFDNTPLSEAIADVSRQTGARFVFADPRVGELRVTGLIDARDLDGFVMLLRRNVSLAMLRRGDGVLELRTASSSAPPAP